MSLTDYEDRKMMSNIITDLLDDGKDDEEHGKDSETSADQSGPLNNELIGDDDNAILIREDVAQIRLAKKHQKGMPTYVSIGSNGKGTEKRKSYKHSQFVEYKGAYIRKSTALYLLTRKF